MSINSSRAALRGLCGRAGPLWIPACGGIDVSKKSDVVGDHVDAIDDIRRHHFDDRLAAALIEGGIPEAKLGPLLNDRVGPLGSAGAHLAKWRGEP